MFPHSVSIPLPTYLPIFEYLLQNGANLKPSVRDSSSYLRILHHELTKSKNPSVTPEHITTLERMRAAVLKRYDVSSLRDLCIRENLNFEELKAIAIRVNPGIAEN